ncbi:thiamine pyrophosphate-dependent dehydrogenase E1 component subunit alpha [Haloferacaceae archaeon DSL9]
MSRPEPSLTEVDVPIGPVETADDVYSVIDADGHLRPGVDEPSLSADTLLELYEALRFARRFDERAVSLQRQGRIATYAPLSGQEGSQVASAMALDDDDWFYPTYRDNASKFVRGMDPAALLAALRGFEPPSSFEPGRNVFPEAIPIATQLLHAVGSGMAARYKGDDTVHAVCCGDGATSQGDFHEALNFAGVFDAPTVFFCHNNQWAISVPRERQTASETIAEKARAYGFDGIRVDGMDPLAVYEVTKQAVDRARSPEPGEPRPTLIEFVEYRLGAHTTADDPDIYRDGVPQCWVDRDPVPRTEAYLRDRGLLDDETLSAIDDRIEARIRDAIDRAEALEADIDGLFEHAYAEPTPALETQRETLATLRERLGDDAFGPDR